MDFLDAARPLNFYYASVVITLRTHILFQHARPVSSLDSLSLALSLCLLDAVDIEYNKSVYITHSPRQQTTVRCSRIKKIQILITWKAKSGFGFGCELCSRV